MSDAAQDHDDSSPPEQPELSREVRPAALQFDTHGIVPGRGAARGRRDVAVAELEAVVTRTGVGPVGESEAVQRRVEPVAARVAREHAAGAVRPVRRGREADDD